MRYLKFLLILPLLALLAACGERVEVPPAFVGKVLTKNGYKPDTIPPSKFRLDMCAFYCDKLYVVEVSDNGLEENFTLFMPKDQLNMSFDIRGTFAIKSDNASINKIFDKIVPQGAGGGDNYSGVVTFEQVYSVYGRPVLREVVRSVIAEFDINAIASSREVANAKVQEAIEVALADTPIQVLRVGLADVQFPPVITKAKENAAERRIDIEKAEAQKQIDMVNLQADLERARMERNIRREKAETVAEENKIVTESVTADYLAYRQLEVISELATNKNTVFVPFGALDNIGLATKMFNPVNSETVTKNK